jgi:hypothetical protein
VVQARGYAIHALILCGQLHRPNVIQDSPKTRLRRKAHGSIRVQEGEPASRVSGVIFPGGGESLTFPRVTLVDPSLWPVNFGISALAGQISGAGLWSPFSNFRLAVAETGSIADRDRFAGRPSGIRRTPARSPQRRQTLWPTCDAYLGRLCQAIARPRSTSRVTIRCSAPARPTNKAGPWQGR